jgi:hypothetical protein
VDPEAVNQIVKAIASTHDGRTWKPETVAAVIAAFAAAAAATVTFFLGRGQIASAQRIAQQQIDAARDTAQKQIDAAHLSAQRQIESAQLISHKQLVMPMREAWIGQLRRRIAKYLEACFRVRGQHYDLEMIKVLGVGREEIELMLNPNEEKHRELIEALSSLLLAAGNREAPDMDSISLAENKVREVAKVVLKSEWQRAKAGE